VVLIIEHFNKRDVSEPMNKIWTPQKKKKNKIWRKGMSEMISNEVLILGGYIMYLVSFYHDN